MRFNPIVLQPGQKFNRWTVICDAPKTPAGAFQVVCHCECGFLQTIVSSSLVTGHTKGCRRCQVRKHGCAADGRMTPEYKAWMDMHRRCRSKKPHMWKHYGQRGITVCPEWHEFPPFLADMGPKPSPEYTLDRIDNNLGYCADNCRWVPQADQKRNTRRNRFLTHAGQTMTIAEWSREVGVSRDAITCRLGQGLSVEDALSPGHRRRNMVTIFGRTMTLTEWAKESGIAVATLKYRIDQGWPEEKLFRRGRATA